MRVTLRSSRTTASSITPAWDCICHPMPPTVTIGFTTMGLESRPTWDIRVWSATTSCITTRRMECWLAGPVTMVAFRRSSITRLFKKRATLFSSMMVARRTCWLKTTSCRSVVTTQATLFQFLLMRVAGFAVTTTRSIQQAMARSHCGRITTSRTVQIGSTKLAWTNIAALAILNSQD